MIEQFDAVWFTVQAPRSVPGDPSAGRLRNLCAQYSTAIAATLCCTIIITSAILAVLFVSPL